MRIIALKMLKEFWGKYPDAQGPLRLWYKTTHKARWTNFLKVRETFRSADTTKVRSGNTAVIFDIGGNKYRLITAIHYDTGCVFTMMVLTHKEYDTNNWKDRL